MLMNLPLLPPDSIQKGYMYIKNDAIENEVFKELSELFEYFEDFWLRLVIIHPSIENKNNIH